MMAEGAESIACCWVHRSLQAYGLCCNTRQQCQCGVTFLKSGTSTFVTGPSGWGSHVVRAPDPLAAGGCSDYSSSRFSSLYLLP